jgi:DNA polymerase-3 subunit delta'
MPNSVLPWHRQQWQQWVQAIQQQRVPQALLISAHKGLGQYQLVTQFAQTLLCSDRLDNGYYCQKCPSCLLFNVGTHPDWLLISPEEDKKIIGIDAIRQLVNKLTLKPQFESYRVVLIHPAEQLNHAAANGFLKCLEEPNERTCIILLAEKPSRLPATIRSRCQKMILSIPALAVAKAWLHEQQITENTDVLLSLAQGAPLLAKDYASDPFIKNRLPCFQAWLKVGQAELNPVILAEQWYKYDLNQLLFWQIGWISDMIKYRYQKEPHNLYHADLKITLQTLAWKLNLKSLYQFYDLLVNRLQKIDTPINKQLLCEELLIHWATLNSKG